VLTGCAHFNVWAAKKGRAGFDVRFVSASTFIYGQSDTGQTNEPAWRALRHYFISIATAIATVGIVFAWLKNQ
jgi:hypothetical protein